MAHHGYTPDRSRRERVGLDEAVFCASKSVSQIEGILADAAARGTSLLLTRLAAEQVAALAEALRGPLDYDPESRTAFFGPEPALKPHAPRVAVVTAGTSDVAVAREAPQ